MEGVAIGLLETLRRANDEVNGAKQSYAVELHSKLHLRGIANSFEEEDVKCFK
jgi:hypothetical protein